MTIYDFHASTIAGGSRSLADFRGQVCLIVNVASECGFTRQYAELEALYRRHRDAGFAVLGFPCNQFGTQEPGNEAAIAEFCRREYDVTFPLFSKVNVNAPLAHPLFKYLTAALPGIFGTRAIKWNFTKFLVGRDGLPRARYRPSRRPAGIETTVARLLREIP